MSAIFDPSESVVIRIPAGAMMKGLVVRGTSCIALQGEVLLYFSPPFTLSELVYQPSATLLSEGEKCFAPDAGYITIASNGRFPAVCALGCPSATQMRFSALCTKILKRWYQR